MASLTGQTIQSTYDGLLKTSDSDAITSSLKRITDGLGNFTPLYLSSTAVEVSSALTATSFVRTGGTSSQFLKADGSVDSSTYTPTSRTLTINGETYDLSANRSWTIAAGVTSFNTRTGAITLTSGDVTGALGYTPYNATNPAGYISGITRTQVINALATGGSPFQFLKSDGSVDTNSYVTFGRTLTINGVTFDLSADRSWTISGGISSLNGLTGATQTFATGTSGSDFNISSAGTTHTFNIPTASSSTRGLLSSADWVIFANRISGSGTTNYIPKFNGATSLANSLIFDNGTNVGIGLTSPTRALHIYKSSAEVDLFIQSDSGQQAALYLKNANNAIYAPSSSTGEIRFFVNGSDRATITSAGNVGIGTTTPAARLDVSVGQEVNGYSLSGYPFLKYSAGDVLDYGAFGATWTALRFLTNGSERMRITSGGNVGIGTTSPVERLDVTGVTRSIMPSDPLSGTITAKFLSFSPNPFGLIFRGYDTGTHSIQSQREGNDAGIFSLALQPLGGNVGIGTSSPAYRLDTYGQVGITSDSTEQITIRTLTDTNRQLLIGYRFSSNVGSIQSVHQGVAYTNLVLQADGGNVGIGTTNPSLRLQVEGGRFSVNTISGNVSGTNCTASFRAITGTATDRVLEAYSIGYSALFYLQNNGSYFFAGSNLSDARAKKDITYFNEPILDKVMQLKPASFRYNENDENIKGGFIAQEVKEVFPDLVTNTKSEEEMMGVDYYGVIALLTKAIQEQQEQINELKAKLK